MLSSIIRRVQTLTRRESGIALPDPDVAPEAAWVPPLIQAARHQAGPMVGAPVHGEHHWLSVALTGLALAARDSRVDPAFVVAFAILHDAERKSDGVDMTHGQRAARLPDLLADLLPPIDRQALRRAIGWHSDGFTAEHLLLKPEGRDIDRQVLPSIGACWDADRLNLVRVDIQPQADLLSLPVTRQFLDHFCTVARTTIYEVSMGDVDWGVVANRMTHIMAAHSPT